MSKLLLEIVCEEIPAFMQEEAALNLFKSCCSKIEHYFSVTRLTGQSFSTPRRIGFIIENLPDALKIKTQEIRGPKLNASQSAIDGFIKKYELLSSSDLKTKNGFYFFEKNLQTTNTTDILSQTITESILDVVWPKSMRWADLELRWVRPIHSILCLLDDEVIKLKIDRFTSSDKTTGHAFMAPQTIAIDHVDDYEATMRRSFVEIYADTRKNQIRETLIEKATNLGLFLIEDKNLLEEVAGLVEKPYPDIGYIEERFALLPKEVLVTTLRNNQKYFMFEDINKSIALAFGIVSNILTQDQNACVLKNHQRVVRARLADAEFFFQNDKQSTLESRILALKKLSFHTNIGSVYDKVQSTKLLARGIGNQLNVGFSKIARAIDLMKTDLLTNMVKEFPELQGVMGYYYALHDGEDQEVADAIRDQYKPRGPGDQLPKGIIGAIVALAEKLDTLNQLFMHGIRPTGSKDPFALRRAAIGSIRIQQSYGFKIDLMQLNLSEDVINFISERNALKAA